MLETLRTARAAIFWAVTLPAAALVLSLIALWQRTVVLFGKGMTGGTLFRTPPIGV